MWTGIGIYVPSVLQGAGFQPPNISGCKLWLRADRGITLSGSDVAAWADLSGNGANATAPGNKPAYGTGGQNGHPYVEFVAASTEYLAGSLAAASTSTKFTCIAMIDQTQNPVGVVLGTPAANYPAIAHLGNTGVGKVGGFDTTHRMVTGTASGVKAIQWDWDSAGPTLTAYANNVSLGSVATDGTRVLDQAYAIGRLQYAATWYLSAKLYELMLFDGGVLSATNRNAVWTYLQARYAL